MNETQPKKPSSYLYLFGPTDEHTRSVYPLPATLQQDDAIAASEEYIRAGFATWIDGQMFVLYEGYTIPIAAWVRTSGAGVRRLVPAKGAQRGGRLSPADQRADADGISTTVRLSTANALLFEGIQSAFHLTPDECIHALLNYSAYAIRKHGTGEFNEFMEATRLGLPKGSSKTASLPPAAPAPAPAPARPEYERDPQVLMRLCGGPESVSESGEVVIPSRATRGAAGYDLTTPRSIDLGGLSRVSVPLGFALTMPEGWEMQIRSRSGLAAKHGVIVLNAPATIDSDYEGEISVILYNTSMQPAHIQAGERIAQAVFARHETPTISLVPGKMTRKVASAPPPKTRGEGGFGSTDAPTAPPPTASKPLSKRLSYKCTGTLTTVSEDLLRAALRAMETLHGIPARPAKTLQEAGLTAVYFNDDNGIRFQFKQGDFVSLTTAGVCVIGWTPPTGDKPAGGQWYKWGDPPPAKLPATLKTKKHATSKNPDKLTNVSDALRYDAVESMENWHGIAVNPSDLVAYSWGGKSGVIYGFRHEASGKGVKVYHWTAQHGDKLSDGDWRIWT